MFLTLLRGASLMTALTFGLGEGDLAFQPDKEETKEPKKEEPKKEPKKETPKARKDNRAVIVLPVQTIPDADTISLLGKVFGKDLNVAVEKDLKVVILRGPESQVRAAVTGLRDHVDPAALKRSLHPPSESPAYVLEAVRLTKAEPGVVAKVVKRFIPEEVEVTEKSKYKTIIFEGERAAVDQAVSLAKQLDEQNYRPEVYRLLLDGRRPKE